MLKKDFLFARDVSLENPANSDLCFQLASLHSVSSGVTDKPGKLCYIFTNSNDLRWLTFLLGSLTVTHTVMLFWIYLFLLMLVFFLQWLSL